MVRPPVPETIADTVRIVGGYANVIVMRHPVEGTAAEGAATSVLVSEFDAADAWECAHVAANVETVEPAGALSNLTAMVTENHDYRGEW